MDAGDALIISALGMGVVFGGLTLTAVLILAVSRLPEALARLRRPRVEPHQPPGMPRRAADPEIVAVIAAALEVERRLHRAEEGRRLTIEREQQHRTRGET